MKNTKKFLLLTAAISITSLSNAQLGGMLKKAAKNVSGNSSSSSSSSSTSMIGEAPVTLDWKQYPMTPAITMQSLLEGTEVHPGGNLRMNFYRATFIPNKKANGQAVNMITDHNVLSTKLYINGQLEKESIYGGGDYFNDGKQNSYESNLLVSDMQLTKEGKYRIDFFAGGVQYYTFDFDVYKKSDSDPYSSNPVMWFSKGPWDKYAFVTPQTTGNFIFGLYMMHDNMKPESE